MGISTIRGRFKHVHGTIEATEDGRLQRIEASIPASSVDTNVPERDTHLLSADFLDAANHREVVFRSTAVEALGGGRYQVHGEITARSQTHSTVFEVETSSLMIDSRGNRRAGATAVGTFSRKQWGLAWDRVLRSASCSSATR